MQLGEKLASRQARLGVIGSLLDGGTEPGPGRGATGPGPGGPS